MSEALEAALRRAESQRRHLELENASLRATAALQADFAERFRITLASIGDAVITTDVDARVTNLNAVAELLTRWTNAEAMGQPLEDVFCIVNETTRATVASPVSRALREGIIVGLANHTILIAKDGTESHIDDSAAPIRRTDGTMVGCVLVFRDISERHRQEVELEARELQFRTLAESIPQLVWMANPDGHIFWYNRRWYEYTGTTREQMEGWGWQQVHHPETLQSVMVQWQASIAAGTPFDMTFPLKGQDGRFRPFLTRVEPVKDAAGRVTRWFGTNTDIAAQQEIEDSLRRNERFNRSLMDATADCVQILDLDGRLVHMNAPGLCAMEIDDAVPPYGQAWRALWPAAAHDDIAHAVTQAVGGVVSSFEACGSTATGTPKWWEVTVSPICDDDDGAVVRLLAVSRDITERRQSEERLRASEAQFRAIFEQAAVGMAQISVQTHRFVRINTRLCDLTGYTAAELLEMTPTDITVAEDRETHLRASAALLRGDVASYDNETRYLRKDGTIVWVRVKATMLANTDGRPDRTMAVIQDVTDRKVAEADRIRLLQQAEGERGRLADVFRDAPAFLCVLRGPDHIYELVNDRYDQLIGRYNVLGRKVRDVLPEVVEQGFIALLDTVYATGETITGTGVQVRLARQLDQPPEDRYLDLVYQALRDADGTITGIIIVGVDVTERTRADAALRSSEMKYRTLFESMDQGYCVLEMIFDESGRAVDYRFEETNPAFEKHSGLVGTVGRRTRELVPDLETHWYETYGRVVQTGEPVRFIDVAAAMDGRWFDVYAFRIGGVGSKRVAVLFSDISSQKRAEHALRESEQRYRAATLTVSDVVWTTAADGLMEGDQPGWANFTGQSRDEYTGTGWSAAVHPDDVQPTLRRWADAVTELRTYDFEHRVRREDGQWRHCSVRAVPIFTEGGAIREWVGVHTDITEQKRTEVALRQFAADMSEADQRKDEFLATLAHELRNPLAPIRNGLHIMKLAGGHVPAVEQTRTMMERQLTQMVRLLDDLMDVSRISRGTLDLRIERLSLAVIMHSALEASRPLIEQMGQEVTMTMSAAPLMVDADMTRLAQVFVNLLNNAAKYGDRGGQIHVEAERDGREVVVTVRDTGIGIDAEQLLRIFDMFAQVDQSLERSQAGLGIGLTLVKRLVELHGGSIEARSEGPGLGSAFIVRLPLVVDTSLPHTPAEDEEHAAPSSLRILIVDDNRDSADSLAAMLQIVGNDVRTAYDGQAGVDEAESFRPDVIIFDIGMPTLNGYEACRRIREQVWGAGVVLIAMTGWGKDEDRRRAHDAGFDHHLVKPVDVQTLLKLLGGVQRATTP